MILWGLYYTYSTNITIKQTREQNALENAGYLIPEDERKLLYKENAANFYGDTLDSTAIISCTDLGNCTVTQEKWTNPQYLSCDKYRCDLRK